MKFTSLVASVALLGLVTVWDAPLKAINPQLVQANAAEMKPTDSMSKPGDSMSKPGDSMSKPGDSMSKPASTSMTAKQKIALLTKNKGQKGNGEQLRRFFLGDLEPIAVQPGGAGMVVNLYNKANNVTFAYCATFDVVVAVKSGKVTAFLASEVK